METSNLELENLIQGFRLSCQAEGKSPRTVEWYTSFLMRFLCFLKSNGIPTNLDQITRDFIRAFIRYLQTEARTPHKGKPLSGYTVQGIRPYLEIILFMVDERGVSRIQPHGRGTGSQGAGQDHKQLHLGTDSHTSRSLPAREQQRLP